MVEDYARACFEQWATVTIRTLAARFYMRDTITPTPACRLAEAAERDYHRAEAQARGNAKRRLIHALARWYASLVRATHVEPAEVEIPTTSRQHLPIVLQADIDRANALAARRRATQLVKERTEAARALAVRRGEAIQRCDLALVGYRHAKYQHERALMNARESDPNARAPRVYLTAIEEAKRHYDACRAERDALRRATSNAYTAIRMIKMRHNKQYPLDSSYLLEV